MGVQTGPLLALLAKHGISLPSESLDQAESHFMCAKFHFGMAREIGPEHIQYPFHQELWQAHLRTVLTVVHSFGDFTAVAHDYDEEDLLCCRSSWDPDRHLFDLGVLADPFAIPSGSRPGQGHPADRVLRNLSPAKDFWGWYDEQATLED